MWDPHIKNEDLGKKRGRLPADPSSLLAKLRTLWGDGLGVPCTSGLLCRQGLRSGSHPTMKADQLSDSTKSNWGSPTDLELSGSTFPSLRDRQEAARGGSLFSSPLRLIAGKGAGGRSHHLPTKSQLHACLSLPCDRLQGWDPGILCSQGPAHSWADKECGFKPTHS